MDLNATFLEAIENANLIPKESVPIDLQLVLYGYYKLGLSENIHQGMGTYEANDLKNAFKLNAMMQVQNLTVAEAQQKYIDIINQLLKERNIKK